MFGKNIHYDISLEYYNMRITMVMWEYQPISTHGNDNGSNNHANHGY